MQLVLTVPDAPGTGYTVTGSGFAPDSWIWITVDDLSDGSQPVNGPDAFHPGGAGGFTRTGPTPLPCGHMFRARAFVADEVVATSVSVTPKCAPVSLVATAADRLATPAAQAVYADFVAALTRTEHRLAVGQALRGWDYDRPVDQPVTALTAAGLPAPRFLEIDLTDFLRPAWAAPDVYNAHVHEMFDCLATHVARGGLIGFSHHADNPFTGGGVYDRAGVEGNLSQLADPDHPVGSAATRWRTELDRIADVMQHFADAAVLFRPLHESNGDWFWWGQRDPAGFRAVWQGMFGYLTGTRGLHHLLWVYSANRDYGDGAATDPTRLFPGTDHVDLVGLDIYDDELSDAAPGRPGYAALHDLGRPFAITEYGAWNGSDAQPAHDGAVHLPNDRVIALIKERYPQTVLATAWYSQGGNNWQISDRPQPAALLQDPWAITLG
jgi:Glycosyl hydrolase family 26